MDSEHMAVIRRRIEQLNLDAPVVDLLCATWWSLTERGALRDEDLNAIVEQTLSGRAEPARAAPDRLPNQAKATGHTCPGEHLMNTNELVDETCEETFPASEPPTYKLSVRIGRPDRHGAEND